MEKKIQKVFIDEGFGFPIKLLNVSMIKVRGQWTPNINYELLTDVVLEALCWKPAKLTGNEIKFIRQYFEMTLTEFAERFYVTHAGVIKWEKTKEKPTEVAWTTEKDIRLYVLSQLEAKPKEIAHLYENLEEKPSKKTHALKFDAKKLAA
jgi:DNA-binding XRE family transcriptional regulator